MIMMIMMMVSASLKNICHHCGNPLLAHVCQLAGNVGQRDVCAMCYNCRTARCPLLVALLHRQTHTSMPKHTHTHTYRDTLTHTGLT